MNAHRKITFAFLYRLPYPTLVGGIQAISKDHFIKINGYSNKFYGWGGEDDNLFERFVLKGLRLSRPKSTIGRYKMNKIGHYRSDQLNKANYYLLGKYRPRSSLDGLNRIKYLNFTVNVTARELYTQISVDLIV